MRIIDVTGNDVVSGASYICRSGHQSIVYLESSHWGQLGLSLDLPRAAFRVYKNESETAGRVIEESDEVIFKIQGVRTMMDRNYVSYLSGPEKHFIYLAYKSHVTLFKLQSAEGGYKVSAASGTGKGQFIKQIGDHSWPNLGVFGGIDDAITFELESY